MIPSGKNSKDALDHARVALDEYERFWLGNIAKVEAELYQLGLLSEDERYIAIDIALQEIGPADRLGPQPPGDIANHPPFHGEHLYAFCWASSHFGKQMYLKFALITGSGPVKLALYSFHEENPKQT